MRDHLRFVISNWYLSDLAFKKKGQLKYIVTAFAVTDKRELEEEFEDQVQRRISSLLEAVKDNGQNNVIKQSELENHIQSLSHNFNKSFEGLSTTLAKLNDKMDKLESRVGK